MGSATFHWLRRIQKQHPKEFGKACQILVAMSFCRAGFQRVDERSVQGVDLDIGEHSTFPKFSLEVKTTRKDVVTLAEKDIEGLAAKAKDGYVTALAILRLGLLSDWVVAKANGLRPQVIRIGRLETRTISVLQEALNREFPSVVADYVRQVLNEPTGRVQEYLQACLAAEKRRKLPEAHS